MSYPRGWLTFLEIRNYGHWNYWIDKLLAEPRVSPPEPPGGRIFTTFYEAQP
jgi:hypothetical protein